MKVRFGPCCLMLLVAVVFQSKGALLAQDVAAAARANRANHNNAASVKADSEGERLVSISVPGESWVVRIDAPDFVVSQDEIRGDGRRYVMATNRRSNVDLSVTLEKGNGQAEIEECRSSLQKRTAGGGPFKITNVQAREINGVPVVEYLIPEAEGINVQQGNFFACMVNADVYIDIHLSKAQFQTRDEALFEAVLKATRIVPTGANASPANEGNARQLFADGSRAFLQRNYSAAIGPYQQALDLEKKQPTLDQTLTRVLIDNLGMAYGITGNLGKSSEVFTYGVSNKAYGIRGEGMPDPRKDDSFTTFMKDDHFVRTVTSLVKSRQ